MKKKIFCILFAFLLALPCLYYPLKVKAIAPVPVPFIFGTAWDSTVSAYGALKGLQFGQNASTPEIVGDYTKPYQYQPESITPLKPSWDSLKTTWIADNFAGIYPALSEEDAKKALDKQWEDFDNALGVQGIIDFMSPIYNAFESWISSLVGTSYIENKEPDKVYNLNPSLGMRYFTVPLLYNRGTPDQYPKNDYFGYDVYKPSGAGTISGYAVRGLFDLRRTETDQLNEYPCVYLYDSTNNCVWTCSIIVQSNPRGVGAQNYKWTRSDNFDNSLIDSNFASIGANLQGEQITDKNSLVVPDTGKLLGTDTISQFPVNPNNDNDKDNKKIAVLPNVPSLKDNLNNLGNVNGGKLPIKFPDPDPVSGLIPSIPVIGNNGVTINIPVTNNNYQVINNYDEHQEIYNENNSYPTINYNYVNYYINEGAMTYEQFLQALQKYFNVIVYNNETNNYYPSTINNTTNNYYTIEEVIKEEIPPILPPSRIAITDRFPFCLPFDIYKILVLFNAEPKAWEWDVPVPTFKSGGTSTDNYHGEIGHIDYSETMHISLEKWEPVAVVLRIGLGILWLLYLCFLFQKLVH